MNKRRVLNHEDCTVYSVNGLAVRNVARPDEEFGNFARANNKVCQGGPPTAGGIGIAVDGVNKVNVHDNLVRRNVPAAPVDFTGGVVVADGASNTTVNNNVITNNTPDIFWDQTGTANDFSGNQCATSDPAGLC